MERVSHRCSKYIVLRTGIVISSEERINDPAPSREICILLKSALHPSKYRFFDSRSVASLHHASLRMTVLWFFAGSLEISARYRMLHRSYRLNLSIPYPEQKASY